MSENNNTQTTENELNLEENKETATQEQAVEANEAEPLFNEEEQTQVEVETDEVAELKAKLTAQQTEIERLQSEQEALNSRLLRAHADYDNLRRRTNEEKTAARKYRAQELVENLLPVLDNFERALMMDVTEEEAASLKQGMEMVYRNVKTALEKEGVEEIQAEGETFDPNLHQAVMQIESDEHGSGQIVEVLQKGYQLNGRVVRPAMVKVCS